MTMVSDQERDLRTLLDAWAERIARHEPARVAELFTDEALFQGFDPRPGYGRAYIADYYDGQPVGLTASYELESVTALTPDLTLAYARVQFGRPDGDVGVYLTVVAERIDGAWRIRHYHVSKLVEA